MARQGRGVRRWGADRWALVGFLLLAWGLRLPPILDNRFHPDEALYGYWGLLIGRGRDPWLASVPVYKPPLLPYLVAGAQALFGNSDGCLSSDGCRAIGMAASAFSVRLTGLAAGLLTVPLVAALAYALYRERWTALGAAAVVALSPFAILFSATAFTDPLMVALGVAACAAAARGRPGWAGVLAGLAVATKQTGVAWVGLAAGVQIADYKSQIANRKSRIANWSSFIGHSSSFIVHFLLVLVLVFAWDRVRVGQGAEGFWRVGVTGYGGLRLIWPQELWTRLRSWLELGRYVLVSPVANGVLLLGLPALVWRGIARRRFARESLADLLFVSFGLIYALFHWLWAFPVWDRYLLPLVPVLAILLARILSLLASAIYRVTSAARHWSLVIVHWSLFILLLCPAFNAAHSRYPVGGDHGAYDGIDEVAAFLRDLPEGAVVYQHWLGWHYDYYLFDAPVYLAYWPTPAWLAQDVRAFGGAEPRYVTFPAWESPGRVARALGGVGYGLEAVLTTTRRDGARSFTVYRIVPVAGQ